jgi:TonB family protein
MRPLQALVCGVIVSVGSTSVAQQSNTEAAPTAKQESAQKPPCKSPKPTFTPDPLPPASWEGKGLRTAITILDLLVDRKGKVHDPVVVRSAGDDVDKQALDSVRRWRFTPATCGTDSIEAKVRVQVTISLR